jgi:MoxR-like ATPase
VPDSASISATFDRLLRNVDHAATSTTKYRDFERFLAEVLGVPARDIYTAFVAKPGNFDVRMTQSARARDAWLRVALLPTETDLAFIVDAAARIARDRNPGTAVLLVCYSSSGWTPRWGIEPASSGPPSARSGHLSRFHGWAEGFDLRTYPYMPQDVLSAGQAGQLRLPSAEDRPHRRVRSPISTVPLILDARIRRMLRRAVASSKAIMLVGPPGTGKSTLVEEMVAEAAADPAAYGLTYEHELSVVTPDESWTARELLGGTTVGQDGRLEFAPGHILHAIGSDQWLLLDEANRADLDRIFGGTLTWLAGQQVTIGRRSPGSESEIVLAWADGPRSSVETEDLDGRRGTTTYRAGQEWRLLGTYNSLDAHRVFRLGIALGRRFAQIPVPPPPPDQFRDIARERLIDDLSPEIAEQVADVVARIYEAHAETGLLTTGPALFLTISRYVEGGTPVGAIDDLPELIAEGYLSAFGTWLVGQEEETLDALGQHMSLPDVLGQQWDWIRQQLDLMG